MQAVNNLQEAMQFFLENHTDSCLGQHNGQERELKSYKQAEAFFNDVPTNKAQVQQILSDGNASISHFKAFCLGLVMARVFPGPVLEETYQQALASTACAEAFVQWQDQYIDGKIPELVDPMQLKIFENQLAKEGEVRRHLMGGTAFTLNDIDEDDLPIV